MFDDSDAPDLTFVPTPSGDLAESPPRGGHGSLDVTQSRATLVVSGRGARRTPLADDDEAALAIRHVDIAPTVAKVLGIPAHAAARYLNGGDAAANPDAPDALLLRQDGKPLDALLEPRVNVFVVVIDGMLPENLTATETPNLCNLIGCPGAAAPDASANTTVYGAARAVMVSQTNANHTAMMTGAYGATSGIVANNAYDRTANQAIELERPELIRVDTLFDVLRRELPHLTTAAVLGKAKLRSLFDCTNAGGVCTTDLATNPEGVPVTHVRPDYLRGAVELPAVARPRRLPGRARERLGRRARRLHHGSGDRALRHRGPGLRVREPRQRRRDPARLRARTLPPPTRRCSPPTRRSVGSCSISRSRASGSSRW